MASASVRSLSMGWTGAQRRVLMAVLDDRQRRMVRDRIEIERVKKNFDDMEAADATQFVDSKGQAGYSCGIPEWACAVLFGNDPGFREMWQLIRRSEDEIKAAELLAAYRKTVSQAGAAK